MVDRSFSSEQSAGPPRTLRLYLLGTPQILWNFTPLVIPRRSVRAILFRLACDPKPVCRGRLQLLFWPEIPHATARRSLTHHLTHLRRALPKENILIVSDERIWLDPDQTWCDAAVLNSVDLDQDPDVVRLHAIAESYRGPFLEDFDLSRQGEFNCWSVVERTALERRYLRVLEFLVEHHASQGDARRAVHYAEDYLETDPLAEAMHLCLIRLYAGLGDRHKALRQFEICSSLLEQELDLEPLEETRATYEEVLHG